MNGRNGMKNDFQNSTGADVLSDLKRLSGRKRRTLARTLIYKKNRRPASKDEQIVLLDALRSEEVLTDFDRIYALIAGCHKVCENVDMQAAPVWLDHLLGAEQSIRRMPIGFGLRKDRTHLVFSALNVALNLDLLTGRRHAGRLCDWFFEELEGLNPRKMTPYLFNTTSNVVKCGGIVALSRPESVAHLAGLLRLLMSYSVEINNAEHWWFYARFRAPSRVGELTERASFGSYCRSVVRMFALEKAAAESDPVARAALVKEAAYLCVAQATDAQRDALFERVG